MTPDEFRARLRAIEDETNEKVVKLVIEAREDEFGKGEMDAGAMPYADDPNWQRAADGLAEMAGWIYDRMAGRNRLHRKSVTKRIRRALGYTYP